MQVGDLVKVGPHSVVGDIDPYNGQVGIIIKTTIRTDIAYYDVLLSGEVTSLWFRGSVLGVINASR